MTAYLLNGTYYYSANYYAYSYGGISINLPQHEFIVNGTSQIINVKFPVMYKVTFTETNVPAGVSWSIRLNNENNCINYYNSTSSTSMTAYLPNGTYHYTKGIDQVSLTGGNFIVNGASLSVPVEFPQTYKVTFTETNVLSGVFWSIHLYNENKSVNSRISSSSTSMIAYLPNGTYFYSASYFSAIQVSTPTILFTVNGTALSVPVEFPQTYKVTFTETNVPAGVSWNISLQ